MAPCDPEWTNWQVAVYGLIALVAGVALGIAVGIKWANWAMLQIFKVD